MVGAPGEGGTVAAGSRVRIREADGVERDIRIRDGDPESWAADSVSVGTPLARALIGHRSGDVVEVELHAALPVRSIVIVAVG